MINDEFSIPPIGGENVPFRELSAEQLAETPKEKQRKVSSKNTPQKSTKQFKLIIISLLVVLMLLIGLLVALVVMRNKPQIRPAIKPQPSPIITPSPEATNSGLPQSVVSRRNSLEEQVKNIDLNQTDLTFPILDFKIRF